MDDNSPLTDEQAVKKLDRSWNEVYQRNDRSAFAEILADDFRVNFSDGRTGGKGDLMRPTPNGAQVAFSEAGMQMFTPTAVTWGRVPFSIPIVLLINALSACIRSAKQAGKRCSFSSLQLATKHNSHAVMTGGVLPGMELCVTAPVVGTPVEIPSARLRAGSSLRSG